MACLADNAILLHTAESMDSLADDLTYGSHIDVDQTLLLTHSSMLALPAPQDFFPSDIADDVEFHSLALSDGKVEASYMQSVLSGKTTLDMDYDISSEHYGSKGRNSFVYNPCDGGLLDVYGVKPRSCYLRMPHKQVNYVLDIDGSEVIFVPAQQLTVDSLQDLDREVSDALIASRMPFQFTGLDLSNQLHTSSENFLPSDSAQVTCTNNDTLEQQDFRTYKQEYFSSNDSQQFAAKCDLLSHETLFRPNVPKKRKLLDSQTESQLSSVINTYLCEGSLVDSLNFNIKDNLDTSFKGQSFNADSSLLTSTQDFSEKLFQEKSLPEFCMPDYIGAGSEDLNPDCEEDWNGSLPHKKRIQRKIKNPPKWKVALPSNSDSKNEDATVSCSDNSKEDSDAKRFICDLCDSSFDEQIKFFGHLKLHYEAEQVLENKKPNSSEGDNLDIADTHKPIKFRKKPRVLDEEVSPTETPIIQTISKVSPHTYDSLSNAGVGNNANNEPACNLKLESNVFETENDLFHDSSKELSHKSDEIHACMECSKTFAEKEDLLKHIKSSHNMLLGTKKIHACKICSKVFTYRNSLMYHLRTHINHRPHECEVCGKKFLASGALKVHLRRHTGDKPFPCPHCGLRFRQWADLKYHTVSIHSGERQFQCEFCGKAFARKYSLVVHRRIHTGERDYRCPHCAKSFRAASYLTNHVRIHTGERPYPCRVCGKAFRVRSDMKRHLNTHVRDDSSASESGSASNNAEESNQDVSMH